MKNNNKRRTSTVYCQFTTPYISVGESRTKLTFSVKVFSSVSKFISQYIETKFTRLIKSAKKCVIKIIISAS